MEIKPGVFYGVGIGPGDPELLTLKALRVLERCPVIAAPQTKSGEMLALDIARQAAALEDKTILPLFFTMERDKEKQQQAHMRAADAVEEHLAAGRDVAMLNLGDVSIYATYSYLKDLLDQRGYETEMVPGVPSFCAVAAQLGVSLTTMNAPLHIVPAGGGSPAGNAGYAGHQGADEIRPGISTGAQHAAGEGTFAVRVHGAGLRPAHAAGLSDAGVRAGRGGVFHNDHRKRGVITIWSIL